MKVQNASAAPGRLDPQLAELFDAAVAHHLAGRRAEAEAGYRAVLEVQPSATRVISNLGVLLRNNGREAEGEALLRRSLEIDPDNTHALVSLANALCQRDDWIEAERLSRHAAELDPGLAYAWLNLGVALGGRKRYAESEAALARARALAPDDPRILTALGMTLCKLPSRKEEGLTLLRAAVERDPGAAHARHAILTEDLSTRRRSVALARELAEICAIQPLPPYLSSYAGALLELADYAGCLETHRQALSRPDVTPTLHSNALFCMNYDPALTSERVLRAYRAYDARWRPEASKIASHEGWDGAVGRRLRVGYVSPDFRSHVCGYFVESFLPHHDRRKVEVTIYAEVAEPDIATERMKRYADRWRDTVGIDDDALAAQIRADGIDVLVDLAGHTAGNRLGVFQRRPAPVQATHLLGYACTTGVSAIDYVIGDAHILPPDAGDVTIETPWRLSRTHYAYRPARTVTPPVGPLPARLSGSVTFGTLTRVVRLNDQVLAAWAQLLDRVPGARLLLDQKNFGDEETCAWMRRRLAAFGIAPERVELSYSTPHWQAWGRVDIALDPFPHHGGTTTIEALWMGVPVVTLAGLPPMGRIGCSILSSVGLDDWITHDVESYVARAAAAAADLAGLADIRAGLRERMERSMLLDGVNLAHELEIAYRGMAAARGEAIRSAAASTGLGRQAADADAAPPVPPPSVVSVPAPPEAAIALASAIRTEVGAEAPPPPPQPQARLTKKEAQELQALLDRGFAAHRAGDLATAAASYQEILRKHSASFHALKLLGAVEAQRGNDAEALDLLSRAMRMNNGDAQVWDHLGLLHGRAGDDDAAYAHHLRATELMPNFAGAWNNLGMHRVKRGDRQGALQCFDQAIKLDPAFAAAHNNRGHCLKEIGDEIAAEEAYKAALRFDSKYAPALNNMGNIMKDRGDIDAAIAFWQAAIKSDPKLNQAWLNLCIGYADVGKFEESRLSARKLLEQDPQNAQGYLQLGVADLKQNRLDSAVSHFFKSLEINPDYDKAHSNLAIVFFTQKKIVEAAQHARRATELAPDSPSTILNFAGICLAQMKPIEALSFYDRALALRPDHPETVMNQGNALLVMGDGAAAEERFLAAWSADKALRHSASNYLFAANYSTRRSFKETFASYLKVMAEYRSAVDGERHDHAGWDGAVGRRMRIGYISPDFRGHVCQYFIEPILRNHDRSEVEVWAFSSAEGLDHHTERMKGLVEHWENVAGLSPIEVAARVRAEGIDVLIDLAGHTAGNSLDAFVLRPAPVQATHLLGFAATTGLSEVDFAIGDAVMLPDGVDDVFAEQVWRLPRSHYAYQPPPEAPTAPTPLPALGRGGVTFGTLSRLVRLNDDVLSVWGRILQRVPGSRLVLDARVFHEAALKERFTDRLAKLGFAGDAVVMRASRPHWTSFADIDISLDPWPHNGGTTIFESILMGVPVLTLCAEPPIGRIGASILTSLGLDDWIAETKDEYVDLAVAWAARTGDLTELRRSLRPRLEASPLMDGRGLTRALEAAYRGMVARKLDSGSGR